MSDVEIKLSRKLFSKKLFPLLTDYSHRYEIYMGSAGSGKSYFITQKIIYRCLQEPIKVLVCRRYGTTLRNSCFALFKEILRKWKLSTAVKIRESDFHIQFPNGSEIIFMGLDDEEKLLSLANISTVFIEEVWEVPKDIFEQLNLRMRGNAEGQQIIAAFNPISKSHWLYDFCVTNQPKSMLFSRTTYKDNPFLPEEYVESLEELYDRNPAKARVYCDGEWGVELEGKVIRNYRVEEFDPVELAALGYQHRAGSDLGFVDPTTIIDTLYDKENHRIYVFNEFYKSGCQLDSIAEEMLKMHLNKVKIFMDASEPRSIAYFKQKGLNVVPSIKGQDSVKAGYSFLQNLEIVIHPKCEFTIRDCENLMYAKDKQTGLYTEKFEDHLYTHTLDGLRYAYSDIYTMRSIKVIDKGVLGL